MDVKAGLGKVWRVPVAGGLVSLSDADTGLLLRNVSGIAKGLAKAAGGIALAGGLLACLLLSSSSEEDERKRLKKERKRLEKPRLPISSFALIRTARRAFTGICTTDAIEITCEGNRIRLAGDVIAALLCKECCQNGHTKEDCEEYHLFNDMNRQRKIFTIDGSHYDCNPDPQEVCGDAKLEFITVAGEQIIDLQEFFQLTDEGRNFERRFIRGATLSEVQIVKERLAFALEHNHQAIRQLLGDEVFAAYFAR